MSDPAPYDGPKLASAETFGLRHAVLSPIETLAQSISTIAPSTTPPATIPLVFALAGQGTAIAYLIAMLLMVLVGLCIAEFARESSSPGSLYVYTRRSLPAIFSQITALALFFAYITTASAVLGGFLKFSYIFLDMLPKLPHVPAVLVVTLGAVAAMAIAYRDIKVSAQLMLYLEGISVCLIAIVIALTLYRYGFHLDHVQFRLSLLRGQSGRGLGLGVMLAIFSFVGFESATTLGAEAREPLRTIPRAVVQSALLSGVFFVLCGYSETMAFHASTIPLDQSDNPLHVLAALAGVSPLGLIIDAGVLISTFAATLSCIIAASRVLLLMAHHGLAPARLTQTNTTHDTPAAASLLCAVLVWIPTAALALHGTSGGDIYGWMGTLAVYGFLTAYGLVAVALAAHLRHSGRLTPAKIVLTAAATLGMLLAMLSNLYPVPAAPLNYFPYLYAAYLAAALVWLALSNRTKSRHA
jgi:amino acid transporter